MDRPMAAFSLLNPSQLKPSQLAADDAASPVSPSQ